MDEVAQEAVNAGENLRRLTAVVIAVDVSFGCSFKGEKLNLI